MRYPTTTSSSHDSRYINKSKKQNQNSLNLVWVQIRTKEEERLNFGENPMWVIKFWGNL